ncbi:aldehyde dehydrogenase family protein [Mycobacterium sp. CVI_P3]|uniref:Aldehyde dehydrogenase n=1 Tax=Mycobacterium pinniadriaticum TaxID=2994102 RepID=A0ABT3SBY5_9MYCO|nr:aldehyde dehydrogenase family protein [Mycobacterium pinniadriaticum]MCX2930615.1 aldehyde dehydrogenase family protein [Mycobacterium pinniadriaticum]MCX2937039.1 aldehyde dehydrogenase family protein [Mycobacterium pinniadriaticum]
MSRDILRSLPTTADGNATALRALLDTQRSDFLASDAPSAAVRRDRIDRLVLLLTENADEFSAALNADFGNRPHGVNLLSEIAGILPDLTNTRRKLESWMRPERVRSSTLMGMPTVVEKKPLGVVGVIGPWNFPISLVVQPTASAFAAGNRVMIKFSEVTARTADLFAAKVTAYFDPTELTVVTGGAEVGAAFSALPFDHLFFTGSPRVGALVAATAGRNLVPVTLELGGKNPAVIAPEADIPAMAQRVMAARVANGGQICLCPDYAFVPRAKLDEFVSAAIEQGRKAASCEGPAGMVSIVDDKNFERVTALIDDARTHGATVLDTGTRLDRARRRMPPTVLLGVTDDMRIAGDEVFGPVLSVLPYDDIAEVCDYISRRPSPLAVYWFGPLGRGFDALRERTLSGGVSVNDFALHCAVMAAPFGGVGHSGSGAYHGKTGFDTFTHLRTVTTSKLPFSFAKLITPPYPTGLTGCLKAYLGWERRKAERRVAHAKSLPKPT